MRCHYCGTAPDETTALRDINLELIRVLENFARGQCFVRVVVPDPIDEERRKDLIKHVSEPAAASIVRLLLQGLRERHDLYRELAQYKLEFGPLRYLGDGK
jgi:hypothetical protein